MPAKKKGSKAKRSSSPRTKARPESVTGSLEEVPAKWRPQYRALMNLRDRLLNRKQDLSLDVGSEAPKYSLHQADAGTDSYDRDFALGMLSSEQDALYEIDEALNRIRSGSYGVCEQTGKPIERERLKAIPWTRFSAVAANELERKGQTNRAHLGRLGSVNYNPPSHPVEEEEEPEGRTSRRRGRAAGEKE